MLQEKSERRRRKRRLTMKVSAGPPFRLMGDMLAALDL